MDIGSKVVTSFQPLLHSYDRGGKSSWWPRSHCSRGGIPVAERRMFYPAPHASGTKSTVSKSEAPVRSQWWSSPPSPSPQLLYPSSGDLCLDKNVSFPNLLLVSDVFELNIFF